MNKIQSNKLEKEIFRLISDVYPHPKFIENSTEKIKLLEKVITLFPENNYLRSYIFTRKALELYDREEKKSSLIEALKYSPDYPPANKLLSLYYYKNDMFKQAAEYLLKADDRNCPSMYLNDDIENFFEKNLNLKYEIFSKGEMYDEATCILEEGVFGGFLGIEEIIELAELLFEKNRFDEFVELMKSSGALDKILKANYSDDYDKEIYDDLIIKKAKLEERNRIMSNLSHHIKNMIGTIIDPLENMKNRNELQPVAIDNAIRGANLVRGLVDAMNLSFKGSIEDFQYDIQNAEYNNSTSIKQMFIESLKYSISSMFDGKYFEKFMRNYFPNKSIFLEAKNKWNEVSQTTEISAITDFMSNYMLSAELDLDSAQDFVVGNDKGSSLKFLILIQEMVFNAVKYSSFITKKERFIKIKFNADKQNVSFFVENKYQPKTKVKSSGLGQEIINNFSKLLKTEPVTKTENQIYSVEVKFQNLWEV
jgi:tetratricopeptide (TPR) repeat protein